MTKPELTDGQMRLIKWLVEQVRSGTLNETGIRIAFSDDVPSLESFDGSTDGTPLSLISTTVLNVLRGFGYLHFETRIRREGPLYLVTLTQRAFLESDLDFREFDPSFNRIRLEPEQELLFFQIVEAWKAVPRSKRSDFLAVRDKEGAALLHDGLGPANLEILYSDIDQLARQGLIVVTGGDDHSTNFYLPPIANEYYEFLKLSAGDGPAAMGRELRSMVDSEGFRRRYPKAYKAWNQAYRALSSSDEDIDLTTVGHQCREAIMDFGQALVDLHGLSDDYPNRDKTVARFRAVLQRAKGETGKSAVKLLDAMLVYTGELIDFANRQTHRSGGLTWEDARRCVFQTLVVMTELDRVAGK